MSVFRTLTKILTKVVQICQNAEKLLNIKSVISSLNKHSTEVVLHWSPFYFVTAARCFFHCKIAFIVWSSISFHFCLIAFSTLCKSAYGSRRPSSVLARCPKLNLKSLSLVSVVSILQPEERATTLTRTEPDCSALIKSETERHFEENLDTPWLNMIAHKHKVTC